MLVKMVAFSTQCQGDFRSLENSNLLNVNTYTEEIYLEYRQESFPYYKSLVNLSFQDKTRLNRDKGSKSGLSYLNWDSWTVW